ncbi:glycosyltransferase family 4 protein [Salmonella enterica]|uniref:glycosyltransferase family 4 protein n=1 Tax=Salmonella enterica TaxID=28901 RepID=UPI002AFDD61F|nr:glycosyltransferase family 4 protein [Salmonella enterica]
MKVLIIGPFPLPLNGMSIANENLYHYLNKNSYRVYRHDTVFIKKLKNKNEQGKFSIYFLLKSIVDSFKCVAKIIKYMPDIVYITPGQSMLGFCRYSFIVIISRLFRLKLVQHIHGSKLESNYNSANYFLKKIASINIKLTHKFILLGKSIAEETTIIPYEKIAICDNGVKFIKNDPRYDKKKINVLYLSNLMKDKGIFDLLDAISIIGDNKKRYSHEFMFHLAGEIEKEYQSKIEKKIKAISHICYYHGVVDGEKKHNLLENSDILILPSYDEGQPLCILEAYSYSCAVVTTNVGGIRDIFKDGENGIFCIKNSANSIVNSLNAVLIEINKYKYNNYILFKNKYSSDIYCKKIICIFNEVFNVRK